MFDSRRCRHPKIIREVYLHPSRLLQDMASMAIPATTMLILPLLNPKQATMRLQRRSQDLGGIRRAMISPAPLPPLLLSCKWMTHLFSPVVMMGSFH